MMALMLVNVDGLKLGGQLDRETSLVAFSCFVYFVHCAFSMLSGNKFYLLTYFPQMKLSTIWEFILILNYSWSAR